MLYLLFNLSIPANFVMLHKHLRPVASIYSLYSSHFQFWSDPYIETYAVIKAM